MVEGGREGGEGRKKGGEGKGENTYLPSERIKQSNSSLDTAG